MIRYHNGKKERRENEKVDEFIRDIEEVFKKHNMTISHEDFQGGFEIDVMSEYNIKWLQNASVTTELERHQVIN